MKRAIIFLLLLIYSVSVSGTAFHLHFCGSYLQAVSFAGAEHKGCCCGKTEMAKNCCEDRTVVFKSDNDQNQSDLATAGELLHASLPVLFREIIFITAEPQFQTGLHVFHSPPIRSGMCELYMLNCTFRI